MRGDIFLGGGNNFLGKGGGVKKITPPVNLLYVPIYFPIPNPVLTDLKSLS